MTDSPPRTRTIAGKTPKFRASCDSCNEAKVRCSQTRPSCARCLKHGVDCVYGISLRAGKHRADSFRNNAAALPATTATVTPNGNSPVERTASLTSTTAQSPLEDSNFPDLLQQQLEDWAYENFVIPGVPDTFQAPHFDGNHHSLLKGDETHMLSLLQTPSLTALHQLSEATLPSIRPGSTSSSSLHNAEFASLSDTYNNNNAFQRAKTPTAASSPGYISSLNPRSELGPLTSQQTSHHPQPQHFSCANHLPPAAHLPPNHCRCSELILAQLPVLPVLFQSSRRPFDVELTQTKEAMRLCARVLACTCVKKDYSCILAVSLLLACIVIVFERGSGGGGTPPDDNDDDADAMQLDSLAATSSAGQAAIATDGQPRFSFGSFQLDVEDERKLKREIVLLQIQKVEGLVAGFQEMVRRGDRAEDTIEGKAWEALGEVFGRKAGRLRSSWERKGRA